jgi:hypothetical protein
MNILDLINAIKNASNNGDNVTVNITVNGQPTPAADTPAALPTDWFDDGDDDDDVDDTPDTDFTVGQAVMVCHTRANGEGVKTLGVVDTVLGKDDKGWYTRVTGNNGNHYRAGLHFNEERLGTVIYDIDD